jgi:hypothetical protein
MTRKMPAVLAAVVALWGCAALAMYGISNHPKGEPAGGLSDWPEGLKELVNIDNRVDGYVMYSDTLIGQPAGCDAVFFFRGDAKAFAKFLDQYAKTKDTALRLVLHPGRCLSTKPWADAKPDSDWSLNVWCRTWHGIGETGKKPVQKGYDITVDLYLGGNIDLKDLEVPLEIEVESSLDIERFVITHDAQRLLVKEKAEKAEKDKAREKAPEKAK